MSDKNKISTHQKDDPLQAVATLEPTLEELLAGSTKQALALTEEDKQWLNLRAIGQEIL